MAIPIKKTIVKKLSSAYDTTSATKQDTLKTSNTQIQSQSQSSKDDHTNRLMSSSSHLLPNHILRRRRTY